MTKEQPFWERKRLDELDPEEWESLCDGCGRCCLVKLEEEDTGTIHFTDIACRLLDGKTCRCSDYVRRRRRVRDCLKLTPDLARALSWLPPTCAYRLRAEGRKLAWWHPLVSGSAETVHEAGISVRGRVSASEREVKLKDYPDHIVSWPAKAPRRAKRR
ncbi:MAG TPA: YcgN family cysteine cluster protein [Methylovirgula sp.]|nr:YcgN family cysteine cluster protein [Methylovirgula sp.]